MGAPDISVVLPVYNGARYLRSSMESVLAQTFGAFELLVCDDGSTDASRDIAAEFGDPRIRFLRNQENRGLFPTLNSLIRESRGDLVRLWAQDDRMYPSCLEREVGFLAAHPDVAMGYCAVDRIDATGKVFNPAVFDATPEVLLPAQASELMVYYGSLTGNIANVMLRRSTLDRLGLFREDMKVSGDFEMWVRIAGRFPIGFNRESLMQLRAHAGQFSMQVGVAPYFIRENRELFATLIARLPPDAQHYARRHYRRHVASLHAHHVVRTLLRGNIADARETFRAIRESGSAGAAFFWWLLTGNGRWLKPRPRLTTF